MRTHIQWYNAAATAIENSRTVDDADGANGNCWDLNLDLPENRRVDVQVCLLDGAFGSPRFCNYGTGRS